MERSILRSELNAGCRRRIYVWPGICQVEQLPVEGGGAGGRLKPLQVRRLLPVSVLLAVS